MVNAILGLNYELTQTLARMQSQIRGLSTQQILLNASTGQDGGQGLSTDLNGLHLFNPAGAEVVTLSTLDGSATLGNTTITGNLSVPNGSITNAALASPLSPASAGLSTSNFATTTAGATYSQQTITVPSGFTQCLVMNGVSAGAWNNTTSGDYLYVSADINGSPGGETAQFAGASGFGSASAFAIRTLTGLTAGSTFTVGTRLRTGAAAWAANTSTFANTNALALFLR